MALFVACLLPVSYLKSNMAVAKILISYTSSVLQKDLKSIFVAIYLLLYSRLLDPGRFFQFLDLLHVR
jgi:hypothetical protein